MKEHTVISNTTLAPKDGRRIEIHVDDSLLTKEECILIIEQYSEKAGKEGQVSVHKPGSKLFEGVMVPWCVNNKDGEGVIFNDVFS